MIFWWILSACSYYYVSASTTGSIGVEQRDIIPNKQHILVDPQRQHLQMKKCRILVSTFIPRKYIDSLCGDGHQGVVPAECVIQAKLELLQGLRKFSDMFLVSICSSPSVTASSGLCAVSIEHQYFDVDIIKQICFRAENKLPALCAENLILPRHFPESFRVEMCSSKHSGNPYAAQCINSITAASVVERSWSPDHALQICQGVDDTNFLGPFECMIHQKTTQITNDVVAELCQGALNAGPVECFLDAPSILSEYHKARLCRRSAYSLPAKCANYIATNIMREISSNQIVELCQSSISPIPTDGVGPAYCLDKVYRSVSISLAVSLCKDATSSATHQCFIENRSLLKHESDRAFMCNRAPERNEISSCLKEAPILLPDNTKSRLCKGSISQASGTCARLLWQKSDCNSFVPHISCAKNEEIIVEFCNSAESIASALCFVNAPEELSFRETADLCKDQADNIELNNHIPGASKLRVGDDVLLFNLTSLPSLVQYDFRLKNITFSFPVIDCASYGLMKGFNPNIVLSLCKDSTNNGPIKCALSAPFGFDTTGKDDNLSILCKGAGSNSPSLCASMTTSLSPISIYYRAILCRGSKSKTYTIPMQCVELLFMMDQGDAIKICAGSTTLTPAYCAKYWSSKSQSSSYYIQNCRGAVSMPCQLQVHSIKYEGNHIKPGSLIQVEIDVIDQFNQIISWDNHTQVEILVFKKALIWQEPIVEIAAKENLRAKTFTIDEVGNFTLHAKIIQVEHTDDVAEYSSSEPNSSFISQKLTLHPTFECGKQGTAVQLRVANEKIY